MSYHKEEQDIYYIPPNFLTSGRLFGGMIRVRNAIEACVLVLLTGLPIIRLPLSLTARIILLCLIPLPLGIFAVIGFDGDSLTEFALNWIKWLFNRRILCRSDTEPQQSDKPSVRQRSGNQAPHQPPEQLGIKLKQHPPKARKRGKRRQRKSSDKKKTAQDRKASPKKGRKAATTEGFIPVVDINHGIAHLSDDRYIKILEVEPINFLLRSVREQKNIISAFASWMKISPVKLQIKVLTKKADISKHLNAIERDMDRENDPKCRELQQDYYNLIKTIGSREAITRRFLIIFEYEPTYNNRKSDYAEIVSTLETAARTAKQYFQHCDNVVVTHEDENAFLLDVLYTIFNRETCERIPLDKRIRELQVKQVTSGESDLKITLPQVLAPESIDLRHGSYIVMDGVYHAYLMVPSSGYNPRVVAGWTSILVNAGEGIDVDFYFQREPKERIQTKLGQQIRINRSRIKDASDTNTDFDDIEGAIKSGYYLKQGLSNYEDFYYASILVTVTADTLENLEWRIAEVRRLMVSQDMDIRPCLFRQEQAMQMVMPICKLNKTLFERSKRNMLTSAAASCYPFTSYEMSDENGILLGVNKHNNSLVIVDIFNSRVYKNANMAILGTSGAGKTFTMQLMALRMRRKGTQVFIIAPLKGHEFLRACKNVGGEFISISPASKQCINIMAIRRVDQTANAIIDGVVNENSILARKIQQLHIFFSLLIPDMNHEEKQLLDEALIRTYAEKGITHDNDSLIDPDDPSKYKTMPLLEDVYNILMSSSDTKRLGNILNRLVHGSAKTFNQHTNVDLSNPYTVLDISELTGDLLTVGMFVALDFVWDKAKEDRTKEKAIFIDEIWQLVGAGSNSMAAEFCLEIFKIIRGYGGAAIAATQDLNDFFALDGGKYGKGIINNAKTKIVLNLEDDEAIRVQDALKLTDTEIANITRFERGNGLISTNSNHITVEFKASALEKQLITTDRYELSQIVQNQS
ncbi:MAG: ATP-binding protein [Clostridiales bacterium]|nr:ATP-binding protein [Clostridiales bacterium]